MIASVSRIRQTVLGLIERPKATDVLSARSEVDSRLSGNLVWQTASQAIALTIARSRGGKSGLASAARSIGQGEVTTCPTVPPALDGMGVQFDHRAPAATQFDHKSGDSWSKRRDKERRINESGDREKSCDFLRSSFHGLKGLVEIVAAGTTQDRSFSSASAPARDEAGFWPVTSLPSVTTKLTQSAAFS